MIDQDVTTPETFIAAATDDLRVIGVPAFADNYLWLIARGTVAAAVDPGDASAIERALHTHHLELRSILVTHHHADHTGGVAALAPRHGAAVYGPARELIPACTHPLSGDTRIDVLGLTMDVIEVPGHTRGHIAYFAARPAWLFCGDTMFAAGCGRLFEGTAAQMAASLARLAALPPTTRVFCAHEYTLANLRFARAVEPDNAALAARQRACEAQRARGEPTVPSQLADELATNPFLRTDIPAVRAAAAAQRAAADRDSVATFAALRAWKDTFR